MIMIMYRRVKQSILYDFHLNYLAQGSRLTPSVKRIQDLAELQFGINKQKYNNLNTGQWYAVELN